MVNGNDMLEHTERCDDCIAISNIIDTLEKMEVDRIITDDKIKTTIEVLSHLQYKCFGENL